MTILKNQDTRVPLHIWTDPYAIEPLAFQQIRNVANLPWVFHHVAVMPDVHAGIGCTIGTVIAMKHAVSPAATGVDIGCGMAAIRTNLKAKDLPDDLSWLRTDIEQAIPTGFNSHDEPEWILGAITKSLFRDFDRLRADVQKSKDRAIKQCGTLGGGNHFIEMCLDTRQNVWIILHSGSRHIGKKIADYHRNIAKELPHNKGIPDQELSVLLMKSQEFDDYIHDLTWAQRYAKVNRHSMMVLYKKVLLKHFPQIDFEDSMIDCHHNYVSQEYHFGENVYVTRKGAIAADVGQYGIIPGSMGTPTYIVTGLGNKQSFKSAAHGAGRVMSRRKARDTFILSDLAKQTEGIECRKDKAILDEIPSAYKDIDDVMAKQKDLVKIETKLRQVLCIKGS